MIENLFGNNVEVADAPAGAAAVPQTVYGTPAKTPVAPNGSFLTGLNLLVSDPAGFFGVGEDVLSGGTSHVNALPVAEIHRTAEKGLLDNLGAGLGVGGGKLTLWLVVGTIGILGVAYIAHKAL